MDLQQMGIVYPTCSHPRGLFLLHTKLSSSEPQNLLFLMTLCDGWAFPLLVSCGLTCVATCSWRLSWAGRSTWPHAHAWQMALLVAGNLVFLHVPSRPPEPFSTWPLEQEIQGLLGAGLQESKNKRSYKGSQGLGPNIRHPHFSRILLVQASRRPAQVQEERNKLHLLMKSLQSHCKRAFVGCCTHLWKIPNIHTHTHTNTQSFLCNRPSRCIQCQPEPKLDSTQWKKEIRVSYMPVLLLRDFSPIKSRPYQSLHPLRSIVIDLWINQ